MTWRWSEGAWLNLEAGAAGRDSSRGVFTTAACVDARPLLWGRHRARVVASLRALWPGDRPRVPLLADVRALLAQASAATCERLRLSVHRLALKSTWFVDVDIEPISGPSGSWAAPLRLEPVRVHTPIPGLGHKVLDRRRWEAARGAARRRGADDAVLVSGGGWVLETSTANVFAVNGRVITTPPAPDSCLPGVMRGWLLERLPRLGFSLDVRPLQLTQLQECDEVWVSNALAGVRRVAAVGARTWSEWRHYPSLLELGVPAPGWTE